MVRILWQLAQVEQDRILVKKPWRGTQLCLQIKRQGLQVGGPQTKGHERELCTFDFVGRWGKGGHVGVGYRRRDIGGGDLNSLKPPFIAGAQVCPDGLFLNLSYGFISR